MSSLALCCYQVMEVSLISQTSPYFSARAKWSLPNFALGWSLDYTYKLWHFVSLISYDVLSSSTCFILVEIWLGWILQLMPSLNLEQSFIAHVLKFSPMQFWSLVAVKILIFTALLQYIILLINYYHLMCISFN